MARQPPPPEPTAAEVEARLGPSFAAYRALLDGHADLRPEWKWYGPKNGWSLKQFHRKRNMCFISPRDGHFLVAFLLNHDAVEKALSSALPPPIRHDIATARPYPEGRPARLEVRAEDDLIPVHVLMEIKQGGAHARPARGLKHAPATTARPGPHGHAATRGPLKAAQRRGRSPG